jgi:O-antigen ligase
MQNYNEPQVVLNYAFWTFFVCIPIGICVYSIRNKEIFYDVFLKGTYLITAILSISMFFHFGDNAYNMFLSYSMLTPLLFHINEYFKKKKLFFIIISVYELLIILLYGSRGALLCLAVFILLKIVFGIKRILNKLAIMLGGLVSISLFALNYERIGNLILGILEKYGYYSRTLWSLFAGDITQLADRDNIWIQCIIMIKEKPIFGWGVGGEVRPLSIALSSRVDISPHNGALELMLNYGIPIGITLSIILVLSICRIFFVKNQYHKDLILIYYCSAIVPMVVGREYLTNPQFFILMFLCLPVFKASFVMSDKRKGKPSIILPKSDKSFG